MDGCDSTGRSICCGVIMCYKNTDGLSGNLQLSMYIH